MSYAIVGFGEIGQALAHAFARKNIDQRDALEADTIILAVPFGKHREVAKALPSWKGKTVIDATSVSFWAPLTWLTVFRSAYLGRQVQSRNIGNTAVLN